MKILIVHNYYQQSGGEDVVVAAEKMLLENGGHAVRLYAVDNHAICGFNAKLKAAGQACYSKPAYRRITAEIASFKPDIIHVHNFFPLLTPSIFDACRDSRVPVVHTLHNFRIVCPGAFLMHGGKPCEKCLKGSPYRAVYSRCYRNSLLASLAVARMVSFHRKRGTWQHKVDRFIALTECARSKFIQAGFPADAVVVKPNFTRVSGADAPDGPRSGALFVGRLSAEKGVHVLLSAWQRLGVPLRIVGDGPLRNLFCHSGLGTITCLGKLAPTEVSAELSNAAFLVMPSLWFESFGLVLIEAFAHSLPVIASNMGSMAEIVENGVSGLLFETGDAEDLAAKVAWAVGHPEEMRIMGENARLVYERRYTAEANYRQLLDIYESAIRTSSDGPRGPASSAFFDLRPLK